mmetsp:Transcript_22992/g.38479  ORF Transcript_22992/g.38479 Transcript_22992/m.38479 type:complete len:249 (-) Transcript_22992:436-1182(-)
MRRERLLLQVEVVLLHLGRGELSFVHDRLGGKRAAVILPVLFTLAEAKVVVHRALNHLAQDVALILKRRQGVSVLGKKGLHHGGFGSRGHGAEHRVVRGHGAPTKYGVAKRRRRLLNRLLGGRVLLLFLRNIEHADGVFASSRKFERILRTRRNEVIVRDGNQNSCSVPGVLITPASTAMAHANKHVQRILYSLTLIGLGHVGNESHSAGIFLEGRIVQTFFDRDRVVPQHDCATHNPSPASSPPRGQ